MRRGGLWKSIFCFFVVVPMLWETMTFGQAVIQVPADYPNIQAAIDAATPGDIVRVADGTYSGNLLIQKAITIESENGADACVIDCANASRGATFSGPEASGAVLSGFTITGGNGQGNGGLSGFGGAILCINNSSPTISDCVISGNMSTRYGGAIASVQSSPIIRSSVLENNHSYWGGGVFSLSSSALSPSLMSIGCTIVQNEAAMGAGAYLWRSSSTFYNCLVAGNVSTAGGGAFYCTDSCSPNIIHCTISGNSSSNGGGIYCENGCSLAMTNSILWGNEATDESEVFLSSSSLQIRYSDVNRGGEENSNISLINSTITLDETNIEEDPAFLREGDYHLSPDSPCIDAGTDEIELPEFDIEGDPRVVGSAPDMGADEFAVEEDTTIPVEIDIKPGCSQNKINLKSWGLLPVAVKTTNDFDVRDIDPMSVKFAGARPVWRMRYDVDRDRDKDMLLFFRIRSLDLNENSAEATLTGKTKEGKSFTGKDKVTIEKPKCKAKAWRFGKRR